MKKELVNKNFENLVLPVVPFEVTDKLPQHLRVILSTQIRGVFALRNEYAGQMLQQSALNVLLDEWWKNHWTMIKAASKRPEWSWNDLALLHNKTVAVAPQFVKAQRNIKYFLRGITNPYGRTSRLTDEPSPGYGYDFLRIDALYPIFESVFNTIAFEGLSELSKKHTSYLTLETVQQIKTFYANNNPLEDVEVNGRTMRWPKFKAIFKEGIGKLPEVLFANPNQLSEFVSTVVNHSDLFKAELYKYLGCCQTTNISGTETGVAKSTIVNKLLTLYFQFVLTKLKVTSEDERIWNESDFPSTNFNEAFKFLKSYPRFMWVSNDDFKVRNEVNEGFHYRVNGSFNQMFTRIIEEVSGFTTTEQFIVSYHPCDLITCSLGYNWSSCQSFINILNDFPANYGRPGSGTSHYSGCYHAGNFQFLTGNGYVVYIPYKEEYPLFLTAKLKRMIMWTNNNLTSMRQNYFYPGKPTDSDSIALASSIRAYLQNVYASSNGTTGTSDWIAFSSPGRAGFNYQLKTCRFYGFDDPIYKISKVKSAAEGLDIIYANKVPYLNTSFDDSYLGNGSYSSGRYSSYILATSNRSADSPAVLSALNSEDVSENTFDFNTIQINEDLIVSLDWYVKHHKQLTYMDNKLLFNSKKYKTASGFKYSLELPANVKTCKHCGGYFTEDLLVDGYCMSCAVNNTDLSIIKVRDSFFNREIALQFTPDTLSRFFDLIPEDSNITWKSGTKLKDFIPAPKENVLVIEGTTVVLKSRARNTLPIFNLENTLKGGENNG